MQGQDMPTTTEYKPRRFIGDDPKNPVSQPDKRPSTLRAQIERIADQSRILHSMVCDLRQVLEPFSSASVQPPMGEEENTTEARCEVASMVRTTGDSLEQSLTAISQIIRNLDL